MLTGVGVLAAVLLILFWSGIRIFNEYERGVVFRLGRISGLRTAGIKWIIPIVDRLVRVDLRVVVMDVPPQDVITRDNVSVKVNAVVYFRVIDPIKATIVVKDYLYATSQLSQTTLRSVLGKVIGDVTDEEHAAPAKSVSARMAAIAGRIGTAMGCLLKG